MKENIEEVIEFLNRVDIKNFLSGMAEQSGYIVGKADEVNEAIEFLISDYKRLQEEFKQVDHECERLEQKELRLEKENEELKQMLDERFIYVTGARIVYGRLIQLDKEIIVKDDLKLRNEINQLLKENEELKKFITEGITIEPNSPYKNYRLDFLRENFILVQKIKDKIEEYSKIEKEMHENKNHSNDINKIYKYAVEEDKAKYGKLVLQDLLESEGK